MKPVLFYLLQVITASSILYGYYHFFLRNKKFHQYNRYYLLASVLLSICIPFLNIPVYFTKEEIEPSTLLQTLTTISAGNHEQENITAFIPMAESWFTWKNATYIFYLLIVIIILVRLIVAILKIYRIAENNPVEKMDDIRFVNTEEQGTPFSFFRWMFWNKKITLDSDYGRQIFRHELFHIREKHTWDIFFLETVRMIFWINPFFHLICKEIKVIHEFLADKFAANKNEEWNYAELLLMQLLGSPNHRLVNPFFHNQIKRRIAMITSSQKTSHQYLRKLLVLPIAAFVTMLFAFKYKTGETKTKHNFERTITVVIDAGHGAGTGTTAPDGTTESDITLAIAKKVKSLNNNDRIKILLTRESFQDVDLKKRGEFANSQKADLFISVHTNYASSPEKSGFEVVVPRKNKTYYAENQIFGAIVLNYFMNIYKTDNEIKQREEGIYVLDQSACPAVLIECGYISNKKDLEYIKSPVNQDKIANSVLQSIEQFMIQQELPDFEEKKKQVSDTVKPDIQIFRDANGKVSGTVNRKKITGIYLNSSENYIGFLLEDKSLTLLMDKESNLKSQYGLLWDEFVTTYRLQDHPLAVPGKTPSSQQDDKIFEKVEVEAFFPGGNGGFAKYLERFMNSKVGVENKAPEGQYTVWIQFIVNKDGSIRDIKPQTKHGYGMEAEAAKMIRKGPKWSPAMQNGKEVTAYRKQRFDFTVPYKKETVALEYENERIFDKVEIEASFPMGNNAWNDFLQKNLNQNIPVNNNAPANPYSVLVQFIVEKSGKVSNVNAITNNGYGMETEAVRVVKSSPKWLPALIEGKKVSSYTTVLVNFSVPVLQNETAAKKR